MKTITVSSENGKCNQVLQVISIIVGSYSYRFYYNQCWIESLLTLHLNVMNDMEHREGSTLGDDVRGRPGATCYDS